MSAMSRRPLPDIGRDDREHRPELVAEDRAAFEQANALQQPEVPAEGSVIEKHVKEAGDDGRHHHRHQENSDEYFLKAVVVKDNGYQDAECDLGREAERAVLEEREPAPGEILVSREPREIVDAGPHVRLARRELHLVQGHVDQPDEGVEGDRRQQQDRRQHQPQQVVARRPLVEARRQVVDRPRTAHGFARDIDIRDVGRHAPGLRAVSPPAASRRRSRSTRAADRPGCAEASPGRRGTDQTP